MACYNSEEAMANEMKYGRAWIGHQANRSLSVGLTFGKSLGPIIAGTYRFPAGKKGNKLILFEKQVLSYHGFHFLSHLLGKVKSSSHCDHFSGLRSCWPSNVCHFIYQSVVLSGVLELAISETCHV